MSSFTKKYNDEEMNAALGEMLIGSEYLETAVYCVFKDTGFFASSRNVIMGYAGITDMGRLLCCKYRTVRDELVSYNMEDIIQIKIKPSLLGQKNITIVLTTAKSVLKNFSLRQR